MKNPWRAPLVAGSIARLAYGVASMLAPEWMSGRLAPTLQDHADARMNLRGFGGAQTAVAIYTLATATTAPRAQSVLRLNALVDGLDTTVSLLERYARGEFDRVVAGGVAVNIGALLCWSVAAITLHRPN